MADEPAKKEEKKTFLQKVGAVIIDFADWVGDKLGEERAFRAICDDMGLGVKKTPEFPKLTLSGIKDYVTKPNPGFEAWTGVIADVSKLVEAIRSVIDAIDLGAEAGGLVPLRDATTSDLVADVKMYGNRNKMFTGVQKRIG